MAEEPVSQLKKLRAEAQALFGDDGMVVSGDSRLHGFRNFVQFWCLVWKSFVRNRCLIRASALAYTTLLALIPLLAVGLGVSTSLLQSGKHETEKLITQMIEQVAPQLESLPGTREEKAAAQKKVVDSILSFINRIHGGALSLTGTVALLFVGIGLLSTIEATLNDIWGVTRGRNWFVRVVHYWAAITLGPLLLVFMMGLAVGTQFQAAENTLRGFPIVSKLMMFVALSGAFMLLYQLMPNTKVHWKAALVGGLVAGALWTVNGSFNALFASRVVSASEIYGSLSALPIFLLGLYLSWTILLFGAQVAYAYQNRKSYVQEKQAESVNQLGREFVGLRLMTLVAQGFSRGDKPPTTAGLAESLTVSSRLISQILRYLVQNKLLVEVATPETGYCPARPLDKITYRDILHSLRAGFGWTPPTREEPSQEVVRGAFDKILEAAEQVARGLTLQEMVNRAEAAASGRPESRRSAAE